MPELEFATDADNLATLDEIIDDLNGLQWKEGNELELIEKALELISKALSLKRQMEELLDAYHELKDEVEQ